MFQYSDKTWIFINPSAQGPIYIIILSNSYRFTCFEWEVEPR